MLIRRFPNAVVSNHYPPDQIWSTVAQGMSNILWLGTSKALPQSHSMPSSTNTLHRNPRSTPRSLGFQNSIYSLCPAWPALFPHPNLTHFITAGHLNWWVNTHRGLCTPEGKDRDLLLLAEGWVINSGPWQRIVPNPCPKAPVNL